MQSVNLLLAGLVTTVRLSLGKGSWKPVALTFAGLLHLPKTALVVSPYHFSEGDRFFLRFPFDFPRLWVLFSCFHSRLLMFVRLIMNLVFPILYGLTVPFLCDSPFSFFNQSDLSSTVRLHCRALYSSISVTLLPFVFSISFCPAAVVFFTLSSFFSESPIILEDTDLFRL